VDELKYQQAHTPSGVAKGIEALTVKIRYKAPGESKSKLLAEAADDSNSPLEKASENLRFASAVAQFGMLLRGSKHLGEATFESTVALAHAARGSDEDGRRAEFIYLVRTASQLSERNKLSESR
jgi:Ca-activated chloride channel family protein